MPPRVAAALLWIVLAAAIVLVIAMTWHPWVAGSRAGCVPGAVRAWDGYCYPGKSSA